MVPAVAVGEHRRQPLEVADEPRNEQAFGRPGASRGRSAFPQVRMVSLLEGGTHVLFGTRMGSYARSELALAEEVIGGLEAGMLCLADRHFYGFELWRRARATGADLLWRVKKNQICRASSACGTAPISAPCTRREAGACGCGWWSTAWREFRAAVPPGDERIGSGAGSGAGTGRPVPRALGDRDGLRRVEDTPARGADGLRSKTPELGRSSSACCFKLMHEAALKADLDADCLRRSAWSVASCRCSSLPPPADSMRPFWTRSWTSRWIPVAAAGTRAG